jgi:hypothetical protein
VIVTHKSYGTLNISRVAAKTLVVWPNFDGFWLTMWLNTMIFEKEVWTPLNGSVRGFAILQSDMAMDPAPHLQM